MYKRILVAYDGSAPSSKAVDVAIEMARRDGAALTVLTVAEVPEVADDVETEASLEQTRPHHQALLQGLAQRMNALGVAPTLEMAIGHPARQILEYAAQADLVVLGHRGRGFFDRWLLGSVAHRVVSLADCDVLVVR
jgi:nucleotide-binding universal stress UspA family protein